MPPLQQLAALGETVWGMPVAGTTPFNAQMLADVVGDGAQRYVDNGVTRGFVQELADSVGRRIELYVMHVGEPARGRSLLDGLRASVSEPLGVPETADTVAFAAHVGASCHVYARLECYFAELRMAGFGSCDEAMVLAASTLGEYRNTAGRGAR